MATKKKKTAVKRSPKRAVAKPKAKRATSSANVTPKTVDPVSVALAPSLEERISKRREQYAQTVAEAKAIHLEYTEGFNPDRLSEVAHGMRILGMLGLEQNYMFIGIQQRVAVGLKPIDVIGLAFAGRLVERMKTCADEIEAAATFNNEQARIAAEKKRRKNGSM